jgi:hypothetical protein
MNLIGVCLGILTASTSTQDISRRVIVDVVREAIIGVVKLLDSASTPSGMVL